MKHILKGKIKYVDTSQYRAALHIMYTTRAQAFTAFATKTYFSTE